MLLRSESPGRFDDGYCRALVALAQAGSAMAFSASGRALRVAHVCATAGANFCDSLNRCAASE